MNKRDYLALLDKLVEKYSRAKKCLADCRKKLDAAELKIGKLSGGTIEEFPVDSE